jgi:hypothetical protein
LPTPCRYRLFTTVQFLQRAGTRCDAAPAKAELAHVGGGVAMR